MSSNGFGGNDGEKNDWRIGLGYSMEPKNSPEPQSNPPPESCYPPFLGFHQQQWQHHAQFNLSITGQTGGLGATASIPPGFFNQQGPHSQPTYNYGSYPGTGQSSNYQSFPYYANTGYHPPHYHYPPSSMIPIQPYSVMNTNPCLPHGHPHQYGNYDASHNHQSSFQSQRGQESVKEPAHLPTMEPPMLQSRFKASAKQNGVERENDDFNEGEVEVIDYYALRDEATDSNQRAEATTKEVPSDDWDLSNVEEIDYSSSSITNSVQSHRTAFDNSGSGSTSENKPITTGGASIIKKVRFADEVNVMGNNAKANTPKLLLNVPEALVPLSEVLSDLPPKPIDAEGQRKNRNIGLKRKRLSTEPDPDQDLIQLLGRKTNNRVSSRTYAKLTKKDDCESKISNSSDDSININRNVSKCALTSRPSLKAEPNQEKVINKSKQQEISSSAAAATFTSIKQRSASNSSETEICISPSKSKEVNWSKSTKSTESLQKDVKGNCERKSKNKKSQLKDESSLAIPEKPTFLPADTADKKITASTEFLDKSTESLSHISNSKIKTLPAILSNLKRKRINPTDASSQLSDISSESQSGSSMNSTGAVTECTDQMSCYIFAEKTTLTSSRDVSPQDSVIPYVSNGSSKNEADEVDVANLVPDDEVVFDFRIRDDIFDTSESESEV